MDQVKGDRVHESSSENSTSGSVNQVDQVVVELKGEGEGNVLGTSKLFVEEQKVNVSESEKHSCVIDVNGGGSHSCVIDVKGKGGGGGGGCGGIGDNWDGEKICRICHLSYSDQESENCSTTIVTDLIELGCGCKDELGIAHAQCAETWFKLRGNRLCEICGETAKNITGIGDYRFVEEWNESRITGSSSNLSDRGGGCWRGQPFCNFLMACLVIAFVLPWFFRVNMF